MGQGVFILHPGFIQSLGTGVVDRELLSGAVDKGESWAFKCLGGIFRTQGFLGERPGGH